MGLLALGVSGSSETSVAGCSDTSFSSNQFRALREPLPDARTRGLLAYNHKLHDLYLGARHFGQFEPSRQPPLRRTYLPGFALVGGFRSHRPEKVQPQALPRTPPEPSRGGGILPRGFAQSSTCETQSPRLEIYRAQQKSSPRACWLVTLMSRFPMQRFHGP